MDFNKGLLFCSITASLLLPTSSFANELPVSFTSIPTIVSMLVGATQTVTYTIKNNTPVNLPISVSGLSSPVALSQIPASNECGSTLAANQSCNIRISIQPTDATSINQTLHVNYNGREALSSPIVLSVFESDTRFISQTFSPFMGVDYAPAHYPAGDPRNDEDESNVLPELRQLQAAGFNVVRMYGEPAKTWIAAINAAYNQGIKIVYQLATCESNLAGQCVQSSGTFASVLASEITTLQDVISQVGTAVFQNVVPLVLIGNEIYFTQGSQSNISDLLSAASQTRAITDPLGIPTSISLQADVWVSSSPTIHADLVSLTNALTAHVPIGINVYPFQWVVPAATSVNPPPPVPAHAVSWYMSALNFPSNPTMITESGWATSGNYINGQNITTGSLTASETYFPLLYAYTRNKYSLLAFMAFDTPTKSTNPNFSSENFYGVFDDECNLKDGSSSTVLLPNTSYNGTPQCSNANTLFTFAGGSNSAQPPFSIQYTHGGYTYTVQVPTEDRTQQDVTPWPTITLSAGDQVTLVSTSSTCTNTVATASGSHSGGTWTGAGPGGGTGSGQCSGVNWPNGSQTVFMPSNF